MEKNRGPPRYEARELRTYLSGPSGGRKESSVEQIQRYALAPSPIEFVTYSERMLYAQRWTRCGDLQRYAAATGWSSDDGKRIGEYLDYYRSTVEQMAEAGRVRVVKAWHYDIAECSGAALGVATGLFAGGTLAIFAGALGGYILGRAVTAAIECKELRSVRRMVGTRRDELIEALT